MADREIVNRMVEVSEGKDWRFVRALLQKELDKATDINNLNGEADLLGAQKTSAVINKVINQIEGAKNTQDING